MRAQAVVPSPRLSLSLSLSSLSTRKTTLTSSVPSFRSADAAAAAAAPTGRADTAVRISLAAPRVAAASIGGREAGGGAAWCMQWCVQAREEEGEREEGNSSADVPMFFFFFFPFSFLAFSTASFHNPPSTLPHPPPPSSNHARTRSSALYRCEIAFLAALPISAYVSPPPSSGWNTGSHPKSVGPRGSTMAPFVLPSKRMGVAPGPAA